VAEVLVYRGTLSDADLQTVHDWLQARYGSSAPPNQPPAAAFTDTCTDLDCVFTDQSTDADGSVVAWSWAFGDGGTSTAQNPTHAYAAAGTYTVTLTVTDDDGDTDDTSSSVTVSEGVEPGGPGTIPNLILWLRADEIQGLADGQPVASWPDGSGLGNHATQSTASKRPIYRTNEINGMPAVFFDASNDGLATPADPFTSLTLFAVYSSRAGQSGKLLNGGPSFFMGPYSGLYRVFTGLYLNGPAVTGGRWVMHTFRQSLPDSRAEHFIDGVAVGATSRTVNPMAIQIGSSGTYGARLDGYVAEVLVYRGTLSDADLQTVHDWLQARYEIP
jgi:PKD repeat protein